MNRLSATGYASAHHVAPRRTSHLFERAALAMILAGDVVAFKQLAAGVMSGYEDWLVWVLVLALSAAATVSMHQAGVWARSRRAGDGADVPGALGSLLVGAAWLSLGVAALWFRVAQLFDRPPAAATGFGISVGPDANTTWPLAVMMFLLYFVGGVTAYGIGFRMHNPARSAYQRAAAAQRRAERAHRRAVRRLARARAASPRVSALRPLLHRMAVSLGLVPGVPDRPAAAGPAPTPHAGTDGTGTSAGTGVDRSQDGSVADEAADWLRHQPPAADEDGGSPGPGELQSDQQPDPREQVSRRKAHARALAAAQAAQLREQARHRLAAALAEPARSSGVFIDRPANPTSSRIEALDAPRP